jgi:hypothetical protein
MIARLLAELAAQLRGPGAIQPGGRGLAGWAILEAGWIGQGDPRCCRRAPALRRGGDPCRRGSGSGGPAGAGRGRSWVSLSSSSARCGRVLLSAAGRQRRRGALPAAPSPLASSTGRGDPPEGGAILSAEATAASAAPGRSSQARQDRRLAQRGPLAAGRCSRGSGRWRSWPGWAWRAPGAGHNMRLSVAGRQGDLRVGGGDPAVSAPTAASAGRRS